MAVNSNCMHAPVCAYSGPAYENCEKCPLFADKNLNYTLPKPLGTVAYVVMQKLYDRDGYGMSFERYWGVEKVNFHIRHVDSLNKSVFFDEEKAKARAADWNRIRPLN